MSASPSESWVRATRASGLRVVFPVFWIFPDISLLFVQYRHTNAECWLTMQITGSTVRGMTDNRVSGLALIAGSAALIITMAFHPYRHEMASLDRFAARAWLFILVASLAVVCVGSFYFCCFVLEVWG